METTKRMLFVSAVLEFWRSGKDTSQIASILQCPEAVIEIALHEGLEIERRREGKNDHA